MIRWVAVLCLLAAPAGAQVFKPKSGSATKSTATTSSTATKSSAKKSSAKKSSTKSSARKGKKKSSAAAKGRPADLTPDDAPKVDPDYVKITDDDE